LGGGQVSVRNGLEVVTLVIAAHIFPYHSC